MVGFAANYAHSFPAVAGRAVGAGRSDRFAVLAAHNPPDSCRPFATAFSRY
jgi:hypothetical protein